MVSKHHTRANNPRVEGYDPEKPNSHILYLDANNLYGLAMSQTLPTGSFQWLEDSEQLVKMVVEHPAGDPEGFILEVDMEYPEDLHNTHNAYPLAPECMVVQKQWMSEYQHNLGVELVPRVNLKKHGPLQWPPFVNPRQSIGNLCCILAGQGLCHFVT